MAGLLKDGSVRDSLLTVDDAALVAPLYIEHQIEAHLQEIAGRAAIPEETVRSVLRDLLGAIELIPRGVYAEWMDRGRSLVREANALGDEDYVALSLALDAPIWSLDRDFLRIPGLRVLSTKDVSAGREKRNPLHSRA